MTAHTTPQLQGAAAVESLLDEEAKSPRGAEGGRSLAMLYRRAMELEYDFFDEHAGRPLSEGGCVGIQ
jgi:hypothetical protein